MDLQLAGRRALVCGGSSGLGRAVAAALVAEGAHVALLSRDEARLKATAEALNASGPGRAVVAAADLAALDHHLLVGLNARGQFDPIGEFKSDLDGPAHRLARADDKHIGRLAIIEDRGARHRQDADARADHYVRPDGLARKQHARSRKRNKQSREAGGGIDTPVD